MVCHDRSNQDSNKKELNVKLMGMRKSEKKSKSLRRIAAVCDLWYRQVFSHKCHSERVNRGEDANDELM